MPRAERNGKRKKDQATTIASKCSRIASFFNTHQQQGEGTRVPIWPKASIPPNNSDRDLINHLKAVPEILKEHLKETIPRGPRGDSPQGDSPQGDSPQGESSQGDSPQGESSQGDSPQGESSQGDSPQGESSQGDSPQGESSQGDSPQGESSQGDSPQGDSPQGESSQGDSPQGESSQGDSPQGESSQGDSPQGDSSQGEVQKEVAALDKNYEEQKIDNSTNGVSSHYYHGIKLSSTGIIAPFSELQKFKAYISHG